MLAPSRPPMYRIEEAWCPICFHDLPRGRKLVRCLQCRQGFCKTCIDEHVRRKTERGQVAKCPICNVATGYSCNHRWCRLL